jgi:hypothetical protein
MHNFVTFVVETVVTRVINKVYNFDPVTVNLQEVALHKEDKINCKKNAKEMSVTTQRDELSSK